MALSTKGIQATKAILKRALPERLLIHFQAADHFLNGERELRLLKHLCKRDRVSLDIGANIGIYTYFARRYSRHVHSYEPNPELCERLRRIFPDVTVRQAAASDRSGQSTLKMPVVDGRIQHELASVAQEFDASDQLVEVDVPCITIDDEEIEDVGFIKIDVEQHEIPVLRGAMRTIESCKPVIMTEITPLLYPKPFPEMFEFITDLGYSTWFYFDNGYLSAADFEPGVHANPDLWGQSFMDNNIIFLPPQHDHSFLPR